MIKYLLLFLITNTVFSQTVSTYFSDPSVQITDDIVFDADGNLYGSDFSGSSVYKVTPGGDVSAFVSGLTNPNGLAFDSIGNLFVVDYGAAKIHKYDSSGVLLDSFDVGDFPSGLIKEFNSDNMIFTLTSNNSINVLSTTTGIVTELYQGAPLSTPVGLAYDDVGNLYTGNYVGREIYKITPNIAEFIATVPDGGNNSFLAFISYGNGNLYGTVFFTGYKIYKINPNEVDDATLFAGSIQGNSDGSIAIATFDSPSGMAFNETENALYVSEFTAEGNIRKISDIPLAVEDFSTDIQFYLSPNPTNNILSIEGDFQYSESGILLFHIYDATGKLLISEEKLVTSENINVTFNVSDLAAGFYFISIKSSEKEFYKRFIKN